MPNWYLDTTDADNRVIQAYAHGTTHDMYVAYVCVTTALSRIAKQPKAG
jgi:hypothetical protein